MSIGKKETSTRLPSEISLLLACGRTRIDGKLAERIRSLVREPLDWDYVIKSSLTHGLMPLLYQNLKANATDLIPQTLLNNLKDYYEKNSARSILLTGELIRILTLFESEGLSAMPYKGPSLAMSLYGQIGLRQFIDLDILVRKQDVWRCHELLISMGYEPHFNITRRQLPAFLKLGYVQMFTRDNGLSVVELHWAIASRFFMFSLDSGGFWSRLTQMNLMGKTILAPSTPDLLLILCVHGAKDLWERLEWIGGIAELIRTHSDLDWASLRTLAKESGAERILLLGLHLAYELFDAELPDEIMRGIHGDPTISALAVEVRENLLATKAPGLRRRILFHLRAKDRGVDRLRYCGRLLLTSTPVDWQILPLPTSLSFLYAFLRPFRLAKKYAADHSKSRFCS